MKTNIRMYKFNDVDPETARKLSESGLVVFDSTAIVRSNPDEWKKTLEQRTYLAFNETPPQGRNDTEMYIYSGRRFTHDEIRAIISNRGPFVEICSATNFPLHFGIRGAIFDLNREVRPDSCEAMTLEIVAAIVSTVPPMPGTDPAIRSEWRKHVIVNGELKGLIKPPGNIVGNHRFAISCQEPGEVYCHTDKGSNIGLVNRDGEIIWSETNQLPTKEQINSVIATYK